MPWHLSEFSFDGATSGGIIHVRELADCGTWNTIAGQPMNVSEIALLLARILTGL